MSGRYGWMIIHERTGQYLLPPDPSGHIGLTTKAAEAWQLPTQVALIETVARLREDPFMKNMGFTYEDRVIHDPPAPDADATPIPTREELIAKAQAAEAVRREERKRFDLSDKPLKGERH